VSGLLLQHLCIATFPRYYLAFRAYVGGDTVQILPRYFWHKKIGSPWAIVRHSVCDLIYIFIRHKSQHQHSTQNKTEEKHTSVMLSEFSRSLTCHRWSQRHITMAHSAR